MGFFSSRADKATESGNYLPAYAGLLDLELVDAITLRPSKEDPSKTVFVANVRVARVIDPGRTKVSVGELYSYLVKLPAAAKSQGPGLDNIFKAIRAFSDVPSDVLNQGKEKLNAWVANRADAAMDGASIGRVGKIARVLVDGSESNGRVYNKLIWDFAADTSKAPAQGTTAPADDDESF